MMVVLLEFSTHHALKESHASSSCLFLIVTFAPNLAANCQKNNGAGQVILSISSYAMRVSNIDLNSLGIVATCQVPQW